MTDSIVSLSNIKKAFGRRTVVDGFNLEVCPGEMIALCGPSGSGKSTILNIIGLLEPFDSGEYHLFGCNAPKPDTRASQQRIRDSICYLFQNFALVEDRSVRDNLGIALRNTKVLPKHKEDVMMSALQIVGLDDYMDAKIFELSGGEQQRVALARCMLKPGELILADEPTGSLDDENRDRIIQILRDMNETGRTVVIVSHDSVVSDKCSRTIMLC